MSLLPQRTLRVLCGDSVIQEIWVKTLTLLKSWACVHGCMIRVIHLLPLVSLQKKGICRSASCNQGCQKASLAESGCVDTLYLFITLLARNKQCVCKQGWSEPQLTHHTCSAWLCSKTFLEAPGSGRLGAGAAQLLWLPDLPAAAFALCQGDYNPFSLCPSFTFFPFHVRHDKEMRNHSLCFASSVSFMSGHCTRKGTQCSAHPACITPSQELYISMVSIFKVSLMCPDPAFSRTKHGLAAQFS